MADQTKWFLNNVKSKKTIQTNINFNLRLKKTITNWFIKTLFLND
jgi:hypothetical protein